MKKLLLYLLFTFVTVLSAFSQDELVLECKFTSNTSYMTLVVFNDSKNEAVEIGNYLKCHYDVEGLHLGNYFIVVLSNPSIYSWTNEIYIISFKDGEKASVLLPNRSSNALFPLEVNVIIGADEIAAKKRRYGISTR